MRDNQRLFIAIASSIVCAVFGSAWATAIPTAFTIGPGQDYGSGVLHFNVTWESSTGHLSDLAQCQVGEHVTYPGSGSTFTFPDPAWLDYAVSNPSVASVNGRAGALGDDHLTGTFDDYIVEEVQFSANQYYWYNCGAGEVKFLGTSAIVIDRDVKQTGPNYQPCATYTVTKLGYHASFAPSEIVTCTPQAPQNANPTLVNAEAQVSSEPAARHKFPTPPSRTLWTIAAQPVSSSNGLGEPVFVDLQVTNLRNEASAIDLGGNGKTNLSVTITGPDGTAKSVRLSSGGVKALGEHVLGSHATYSERLILNEWNGFHEVGDYSVHVALDPEFGPKADDPPVADLHVSIGPRNRSKLRAMANMFAARSIDGVDFANRDAAARALSYMSDATAVPAMKRVLMSGSDAGLPLIGALARLGGPSALDALQSARSSRDAEVRDAAVRALRALRDGRPVSSQVSD
ncbi:MAG: HEAT repeat domain-containing protein [Alphaproteobacteria bacterium]|nr:HEAT repeat domain-containing protein [Alphaproteobacteria bacterium]